MICADTSAIVDPSGNTSCMDHPNGRLYTCSGLMDLNLLMSMVSISFPALCVLWIQAWVRGMCFLALVVHDDAANLCIFSGRRIFASCLDCSIHGLSWS
jgi:hypothetical protein